MANKSHGKYQLMHWDIPWLCPKCELHDYSFMKKAREWEVETTQNSSSIPKSWGFKPKLYSNSMSFHVVLNTNEVHKLTSQVVFSWRGQKAREWEIETNPTHLAYQNIEDSHVQLDRQNAILFDSGTCTHAI